MFQNNKFNLVISIVAAIGLWAYVFFEINPVKDKTISDVPVKLVGINELQDRGLTVRQDEEFIVNVKIKGPRSEVTQIKATDVEATADVSTFTEGKNDVKVNVTVPESVSKEDIEPSTINITIEEYVTESRTVEVKFEGVFEEDAEPGFVSRNPDIIEVSGAKSLVKKVAKVQTVVKSESVKEEEQNIETTPSPVDKEGNTVNGLTLSTKSVDVKCTLCFLKTVPLKVPIEGEVDSEYEVTDQKVPDSVRIKGVKSQINSINSLVANTINIDNINETSEIPVVLNLPENVEVAKESENLVVVIEISGVGVKNYSFSNSDINIRNLKSGYSALIEDGSINISIYGSSEYISALERSDVTLYIDLKDADYSHNTITAEVKYSLKKSPERVVVSPTKVQVTIDN